MSMSIAVKKLNIHAIVECDFGCNPSGINTKNHIIVKIKILSISKIYFISLPIL